ncbi:CPBP family intramembrane glutamic endopeptidase [Desertivirga xinjiangensis]|uniref:CPBP family intramembrane glutamic endopeptidase n=1 Tax=Desertivirga xinjiangensis TaxID=539206 RepID=UPI0034E22A7A
MSIYIFFDIIIKFSALWLIFRIFKVQRTTLSLNYNFLFIVLLSLTIFGLADSPLIFRNPIEPNDTNIYKIFKYLISSVIVAPIFEELLYRKIFLQQLLNKKVPNLYSIVIVSVPFTLVHAQYLIPTPKPLTLLAVLITSLAISWVYVNTRNVFICIVIHSICNVLAFFCARINQKIFESLPTQYIGFLLSIIIFGGLYFIMIKRLSSNYKS